MKFVNHSFKHTFHKKKGDLNKSISEIEKAAMAIPSRKTYFNAALSYLKEGFIDKALTNIDKGTKSEGHPKIFDILEEMSLLVSNFYVSEYLRYKKELRKNPDNLNSHLNLYVLHYLTGDNERTEEIYSQIESKFPDRVESKALHAIMLQEIGKKEESRQKWGDLISLLLKDSGSEYNFSPRGESTNKVLEYRPREFFKDALLFKEGNKDCLEQELEMIDRGGEISQPFEDYGVPESRDIFPFNGSYVHSLKREKGRVFYELSEDTDLFLKTADFLALIHARMPLEGLEPVDIAGYIDNKLSNPDMELSSDLAEALRYGINPALDNLSQEHFVFNKDAHPEQWIITETGKIIALDWENKGLVPMQFDLANLLEYGDCVDQEDKHGIISKYIESFNGYSKGHKIENQEQFFLRYLK